MSAAEQKKGITPANNARIVIVDDEPSIRKTIEGVLHDEGYGTVAVGTAQELFKVLESESPLLVLLDIWLPGMDGIETLERLRQINSSIPVIMMSGHATIATAMKATKLGAADFIEKPIDLDLLLKSIKGALQGAVESAPAPEQTSQSTISAVSNGARIESLNKIALSNQPLPGRSFNQRTLKN